jgi:hypothetical protein
MGNVLAYAQANKSTQTDIVCPATGTASIEMLAKKGSRYSFSINNTSGIDIRWAYVASGTTALLTTNSFLLKAGQPYSESSPGVHTGRLVCMSTTAVAATISVNETYR